MDEQAKTEIGLALSLFMLIAGVMLAGVCYFVGMPVEDDWLIILMLVVWVGFGGWAVYQFCRRND